MIFVFLVNDMGMRKEDMDLSCFVLDGIQNLLSIFSPKVDVELVIIFTNHLFVQEIRSSTIISSNFSWPCRFLPCEP